MPAKTFAETSNSAKTMISGLKANAEAVGKRGLDMAFTFKLESNLELLKKLDNEQEALKAQLKTKTAELDATFALITEQMTEATKVVKISVDQTTWRAFGIEATK